MRLTRVGASDSAVVRTALWVLGLGGVLASLVLMKRLGTHAVLAHIAAVGPAVPVILIVTGLRYPLQTAGWWLALKRGERPAWPQAIGATIAGSAVSYLTFAGPIAGEPTRAMLLRSRTNVASGIAAGAVERTFYAITGAFVTIAGFLIAAVALGLVRDLNAAAAAVATAIAGGIVIARRVSGRRRAAVEGGPRASGWRETVGDLWHTRRGTVGLIVLADAGQHALLLAEAWLILHALGQPVNIATVFMFESTMKAANSIGTFVPGGIGVIEGGSALLATGLGLGADVGLTLALVRRARAVTWAAAGLAILAVFSMGLSSPRSASRATTETGADRLRMAAG